MACERQAALRRARMGLLWDFELWRHPLMLAHERALRRANEGSRGLWRLRKNLAEAAVEDEELHEYLVGVVERWLAWQGPILRRALDELEAELSRRPARRRIAALRETAGRSPQEIAAYQAKADELERRLTGAHTGAPKTEPRD
jgi:hypothetical protein